VVVTAADTVDIEYISGKHRVSQTTNKQNYYYYRLYEWPLILIMVISPFKWVNRYVQFWAFINPLKMKLFFCSFRPLIIIRLIYYLKCPRCFLLVLNNCLLYYNIIVHYSYWMYCNCLKKPVWNKAGVYYVQCLVLFRCADCSSIVQTTQNTQIKHLRISWSFRVNYIKRAIKTYIPTI